MAKVLIVEDDILLALGMADVVGLAGYEVVGTASRVSEAIEKARTAQPDIAVLDIRLAGRRDGIEAASILKQMCGTEVVFISAESDEGTLERAKSVEPVAFLQKPCAPSALLNAVQKAGGPGQTPAICR
jgi:two-component system, response regulator PdtaR